MNKKKTIITISIYLACLLVVIFGFLFFLKWDNARDKTRVYIATTDIAKGTAMTEQTMASNFKYVEVPNGLVDGIEESGTVVVDDTGLIVNKVATVEIKKGTTLTTSMFGTGEGLFDTEVGFIKPQRIYLDVPAGSEPVDGFKEDMDVTLFGKLSVNDDKGSTKNIFTTITNKMRVKEIVTKEDGTVGQVAVVVEYNEMARILQSIDSAEKYYFLKGALEKLPPQLEDEIKNDIFNDTGYQDKRKFKLNLELRDGSNLVSLQQGVKTYKNDTKLESFGTFVIGAESNQKINFTWEGQFTEAFVTHKNFDGTTGTANGTYLQVSNSNSADKNINYDTTYDYRTFKTGFKQEGYYEIEFRGKEITETQNQEGITITTSTPATYTYRFVIENTKVEYETLGDIKIKFNADVNSWKLGAYENTMGLYKPYYLKIEELKNYREEVKFASDNKDFLKTGGNTYDLNEGIGTFGNETIDDISLKLGNNTIKTFYGFYEKDEFDVKPDANIKKFFTTSEKINLPVSDDNAMQEVTSIELMNEVEYNDFIKDKTKQELLDIIKILKDAGLNKLADNTNNYIRAFAKLFLVGKDVFTLNQDEINNLKAVTEISETTIVVSTETNTYEFNVEFVIEEAGTNQSETPQARGGNDNE